MVKSNLYRKQSTTLENVTNIQNIREAKLWNIDHV